MLLLWIRVLKVLTLMEGSVYNGCTLTNLVSFYFGMKATGFFTCNRGLPFSCLMSCLPCFGSRCQQGVVALCGVIVCSA